MKTHNKIELIQTNMYGQMSVASLNRSNHFLTFIDDFSKMYWVYFLTHKSEVAERFEEFKSNSNIHP